MISQPPSVVLYLRESRVQIKGRTQNVGELQTYGLELRMKGSNLGVFGLALGRWQWMVRTACACAALATITNM